jgi:aconitate hydratase
MVLAKSIERIHRANLINFGIIPAIFINPDDYGLLEKGQSVQIKGVREALSGNGMLTLETSDGKTVKVSVVLTDREKKILLAGGLLNATKTGN